MKAATQITTTSFSRLSRELTAQTGLLAPSPTPQGVRGEPYLPSLRGIWPFIEEDDGGFATPEYQKAINDVRAALAMTEDANP